MRKSSVGSQDRGPFGKVSASGSFGVKTEADNGGARGPHFGAEMINLRQAALSVAKLCFLRASGDSMEPTIGNNALLLIDERIQERQLPDVAPRPKSDYDHPDIYVFLLGPDLRVKRLRKKPNGDVLIMSDNRAHDPELLRGDDLKRLKICGRVIWWDNRL